jgi:Glyoxalase-like domain
VNTGIDHLTVTAPSLAVGADYVTRALGVEMQQGGAHPRMGTHNLLLRLGDAVFMEVIAADPAAPRPAHARWFELDKLTADSPARLAAWVARAPDIRSSCGSFGSIVGNVKRMTRGTLSWLITIPADGSLPLGGAGPALIDWQGSPHPASTLKDAGCTLLGLEAFHPEPERVLAILASIQLSSPVQVRQTAPGTRPTLVAHIRTPHGLRTLPAL